MSLVSVLNAASFSLQPATPLDIFGASGLDVSQYNSFSMILENDGANNVTALEVRWSDDPDHTEWSGPDASVTFMSLTPGNKYMLDFYNFSRFGMKLTITSLLGTKILLSATARGNV